MELTTLIALIGLAISIGGVLVRHERRYNELLTRITVVEHQIAPFWDFMRENLGAIWTPRGGNAHNPPSRELITRLATGTITPSEATQLEHELRAELNKEDSNPLNVLFTLWVLNSEKRRLNGGDDTG